MQKPSLALAFMTAMLLHLTAPGMPPANAQTSYRSGQPDGYELADRDFVRLETTGAIADIEAVRNEPSLIFDRPEPGTPGRLCAIDTESRRVSEVRSPR